jgi:hypothetical protein
LEKKIMLAEEAKAKTEAEELKAKTDPAPPQVLSIERREPPAPTT